MGPTFHFTFLFFGNLISTVPHFSAFKNFLNTKKIHFHKKNLKFSLTLTQFKRDLKGKTKNSDLSE